MKQIFYFLLLITPTLTFSQSFEPPEMRFGKDYEDAVKQDSWEIVTDDDALILFAKSDYSFEVIGESIGLEETYHFRYKVLTKEGTELADVKLLCPTYLDEQIGTISASSYTMVNGSIEETKLKRKDVFKKDIDDYISEYSFAIPNVKEGSVFEFEYTRRKPGRYRPSTWYFNDDVPVLYSQNSFNVPEWYSYQEGHKGITPYVLRDNEFSKVRLGAGYESVPSKKHILAKANMPAFKEEAFVANIDDYREHHRYRLEYVKFPNSPIDYFVSSWKDINYSLLNDEYADIYKDSKHIQEVVTTYAAHKETKEEKIIALYNYVTENIDIEYEGWVFPSKNSKQIIKNGAGNLADANLLLVSLLHNAGIKANPLLISTREDGYLDFSDADPASFSYPIVMAERGEGDIILLNASSTMRPYDHARPQDYNRSAWMVSSSNPDWVDAESLAPVSKQLFRIIGELDATGNFSGNIESTSTGFISIAQREQLKEKNDQRVFENLFEEAEYNSKMKISDFDHSDIEDCYENFTMSASVEIPNYSNSIGDFLYFDPFILGKVSDNPFKKEDRDYPVDIPYPKSTIITLNIKLPEGYKLEEVPQPQQLMIDERTSAVIMLQEMSGSIIGNITFNSLNTFILPKEFDYLREYTDALMEQTNKTLTLVKSSN